MQASAYLTWYPAPERPGWFLVFSTRRTSLALLPGELLQALLADRTPAAAVAPLADLGFLVADREEERAAVAVGHQTLNRLSPTLAITVVLGMACNFSCRYCYEGNLKDGRVMDERTAGRLIDFVKERFTPGKTRLRLEFYGGETLLYTSLLKRIAAPLRAFAAERGAGFEAWMASNGALLTGAVAEDLRRSGLTYAKVTLDGPSDCHNRFRPFRDGRPSFAAIVANLREASRVIDIGVGGNFTAETYPRFPELLDHLIANDLGPARLAQVKFDPVMQINDEFASGEGCGGCESVNEPWVAEATLFLREEIMKRGFHTPRPATATCAVDLDYALTVHCDGSLYKCMPMVGHERFRVGDIWNGIAPHEERLRLGRWRRDGQCMACLYLPLCYGGCRYVQYQRDGAIAGVDCQKGYFDAVLEGMIRQEAAYR